MAQVTPRQSHGRPKRPGAYLLNDNELQLPISLFGSSTKAFDAARFINAGEWLRTRRQQKGMTQKAAAADLGIPLRQLLSFEATARWPQEAKDYVRKHTSTIGVVLLVRHVANRKWSSKSALMKALERIVTGRPPRKRAGASSKTSAHDPNIAAVENIIRDRLSLRLELRGDGASGELRIYYGTAVQFERILEVLGI